MITRSSAEICAEMFDVKATVEDPWTWRDKLTYRFTGRVSSRVYAQRMAGMVHDDLRRDQLMREYRAALDREEREHVNR